MDIRQVDLNLLPVLDALLRHQSVTLAAQEMDMSQSALSSALARLRSVLGDPLFVRTGRGLRPTARAIALSEPLALVLKHVRDSVLLGGIFDPATTHRLFRLSLSDVGSYVLWPTIVRAVREVAPHVTLQLRTLPPAALPQTLESGDVDLAVGAFVRLPESLFQRRLYERKYVCLVRSSHRLARRSPTLRQFANTAQIVVRTSSGIQDQIDQELLSHGLRRIDTQELPSYLMIPPLLRSDDYLAVVPEQLAEAFSSQGGFAALNLPISLPTSTIRLYWHRRSNEDAGNAWLRTLIVDKLCGRD